MGSLSRRFLSRRRARLLGYQALLGTAEPDGIAIDAALVEALEGFIAGVEANQVSGVDATSGTAEALAEARRSLNDMRALGCQEWRRWVKLAKLQTRKKSEHLLPPLHEAALRVHSHPALHADARDAIEIVFDVAARSLAAYSAYKNERRAMDFVDQEALALRLLRLPPVAEQLREEISLVLVDEFQDTSPIQLAIFLELAGIAKKNIWVGDQKQAIYGFRGTDPALMDAVVIEILGDAEPITLSTSYRSRPALVKLTSEVFSKAFSLQGLPESRVRLTPGNPQEAAGLGPIVERWTLGSKNQEADARALAGTLRSFLADDDVRIRDRGSNAARKIRPLDTAVLCRRRAMCALVAAELAAAGVAAVLPRTGLLRTPEGRLLLDGLRLWADPDDALAAAEVARFVSLVDDADGWLLTALQNPYGQKFREAEPVATVLAVRAAKPHLGPLSATDEVMTALGIRELCLRWGNAAQRLGNLDAFRAHVVAFAARASEDGIAATVSSLVNDLARLEEEDEDSQAVVGSADAVTVTTWHAAKGLEWPVTVLFQLEKDPIVASLGVHADATTAAVNFTDPLAGRRVRFWPNPFHPNQTDTPFHERLSQTEEHLRAEAREQSQELRLLYVGWTRARDRVVLAGRGSLTAGILGFLRDANGPLLVAPKPTADIGPASDVVWAGEAVALRERMAAVDSAETAELALEVAFDAPAPRLYAPAFLAPSSIATEGTNSPPIVIGQPVPLPGDLDMAALGNALHGFFAADLPGLTAEGRVELAAELLRNWRVGEALDPNSVVTMSDRLRTFVNGRWPNCAWHREWSVERVLDGGTRLRGAADLVLETTDGFVVIDHKSYPNPGGAEEHARAFAGQLHAYAGGIEAARKRPTLATLVHFPVAGLMVPVGLAAVVAP